MTSFILRFTQDQQALDTPWHGVIRHVQNNEEIRFTRIEDALAFINGYVPVSPSGEDEPVSVSDELSTEGE